MSFLCSYNWTLYSWSGHGRKCDLVQALLKYTVRIRDIIVYLQCSVLYACCNVLMVYYAIDCINDIKHVRRL